MNCYLNFLNLKNQFYHSSLFIKNSNYFFNNIIFSNSFNYFFCSFFSKNIHIKNSKFNFLLNTVIILNNINFLKQNFTIKPSYTLDIFNFISNCVFWKINSESSCAGIYINSNINVTIFQTGFFNLYNSISYGGSAIYAINGNNLSLIQVCFYFCKSIHGASFGINTNTGSINDFEINLCSESFVGYLGLQEHSSYFGAKRFLKFESSNFSNIISSGNSGSFYILHTQIKSHFKFIQTSHSKLPYILFTQNPSLEIIFNQFNFINLSVSYYYFWVGNFKYEIQSCIFNLVSNNVLWANQNSNLLNFLNCKFSQLKDDSKIINSILINFSFLFFDGYNNILNLNTYFCWAFGNPLPSSKKTSTIKIFLILINF